ncbi:hypothetical protein [uncultured Alteromonas sp.]|uniref:hypothetical protein n=1 Tax=uncultured Alteromonas sp. TaxID=179113 RepID=UPI0025ECB464|nr:hypothetical protein [uncultured Alteromonas sp.]
MLGLGTLILAIDPVTKQKEERIITPFEIDNEEHTYVEDMPDFFFVQESSPKNT